MEKNARLHKLRTAFLILIILLGVFILALSGLFYYRSYARNQPKPSAPQASEPHTPQAQLLTTRTYVGPDGSTSTVTCDIGITPEMEEGWLKTLREGTVTDNPDGSRTYRKDEFWITVTSSIPLDAETQRNSVISAMTSGVTK